MNPIRLVGLVPFMLLLSIGLSSSLDDLTSILRQRGLLLRSLLAVLVLVPAAAILLLILFDLPPAVAGGIALLAASPGAPLTTKRSEGAVANRAYVSSLQLVLGLLAILVTPAILALFNGLFALPMGRVSPATVAVQVAEVALMPVVAGLALRRFAPKLAARAEKPVRILANALFLLMTLALVALILLGPQVRSNLLLGGPALAALGLLALVAVAVGHLLGGPRPDYSAGLATASVARNIGLAMFLAGQAEAQGDEIVWTLAAYMIVGFLVALPYGLWVKRQPRT